MSSSAIAIYSGSTLIYWSSLVICVGLLAGLFLSLAVYTAKGGRAAALLLLLPLGLIFSIPLCRALHWYCHVEQYAGFFRAITDYSGGSYCLPGAFIGMWMAAILVSKLRLAPSTAALLDGLAPGAALAIAFIRLSAIFDTSCRGTITVNTPILQHLPLASGIVNSAGNLEYRFATFFVQFILMLILAMALTRFYSKRSDWPVRSGAQNGHVMNMFLLWYSAIELVMDSTRYDSSFMRFNNFVSVVQIVCAICIIGVLVYYSVHAVKAKGLHFSHFALWTGFIITVAAAGLSEYMVQRHGNWYLGCYAVMSISAFLMCLLVYQMYLRCCKKKKSNI